MVRNVLSLPLGLGCRDWPLSFQPDGLNLYRNKSDSACRKKQWAPAAPLRNLVVELDETMAVEDGFWSYHSEDDDCNNSIDQLLSTC